MYLKKINLKNKVALVTGAGKGIGRACSIALAEAGATIIGVSRTTSDLDKLQKDIKKVKGKLIVDLGAKKVIKNSGKSLLPIGIKSFDGIFQKGDVVAICDSKKVEIARGLSNYDSECLKKIIGKSTKEIKKEISRIRNIQHFHL